MFIENNTVLIINFRHKKFSFTWKIVVNNNFEIGLIEPNKGGVDIGRVKGKNKILAEASERWTKKSKKGHEKHDPKKIWETWSKEDMQRTNMVITWYFQPNLLII